MVTRSSTRRTALARRGALMTELIVALSIVIFTIFPLALAFLNEQKLCRAYYYRALALEIVDGEMEGWPRASGAPSRPGFTLTSP